MAGGRGYTTDAVCVEKIKMNSDYCGQNELKYDLDSEEYVLGVSQDMDITGQNVTRKYKGHY